MKVKEIVLTSHKTITQFKTQTENVDALNESTEIDRRM